ncbi:bromodomain-containing protein 7 isoform X2 [Bacillus rossius redtenbacheri]|uniref:bromodomain-containing protein 7 isoform X2 n=1 Tax=Bacillus rossius redtenbacheri TaxID=93214 RepID=UPI002FDCD0DE
MGSKKHKKHKSDRKDRYEGPSVPLVHTNINYSVTPTAADDESRHSAASFHGRDEAHLERQHKKAKKKKKKKEKDKDREKHEKKHKHHHKEKRKRIRDESSQDDISIGEESLSDPPLSKRIMDDNGVVIGVKVEHGSNSMDGLQSNSPAQGLAAGPGGVPREPRTCVLRQRQERTALQKLLDYLLKGLEKRDPQQFFAWPVTDHIAPGYSQIISQPMDFSTMKQKIDDNQYATLADYIEDFKLMCNNAMVYNHPETIYYKAAKKLLHVGLKMMTADKLKPLRSVVSYMAEIPQDELGFELGCEETAAPLGTIKTEPGEDGPVEGDALEDTAELQQENKRRLREANKPLSKFEPIPDDLTPEEILEQAQRAAQSAAQRLSLKRAGAKMGFLRQRKDGTTSLAIVVPNDGVTPGTNERPISLGMLCGKLTHGTGQLQGFREDRRNLAKTVKPLYYGAFGSYAPSYDSTFANLTKEETDLIYQTYGDETAVKYAESILDFSKDCDYTLTMVDNLLDLLTAGEHRKTKHILEEKRKLREEEERIRQLLEDKGSPAVPPAPVDIGALKSLSDIGIDTSFLESLEKDMRRSDEQKAAEDAMQAGLDHTSSLLQKLQQVQNDRLSLPPPAHLAHVPQPSENEVQLAEKITESLKDMAKKVPPGAIAPVSAVRKAMGVQPAAAASPAPAEASSGEENPASVASEAPVEEVDVEGTSSQAEEEREAGPEVPDLESELREFLESEPALSNSPLQGDRTIEEILSES